MPDTDTRADWAQDPDDLINGRKAQYPGWELDRFFLPRIVTEPATLEVFLAPDNSFAAIEDSAGGRDCQHPLRGVHDRECPTG